MKYITTVGQEQFTIDINQQGQVAIDEQVINADMQKMPDTTMYSIIIDGKSHDIRLNEGNGVYIVQFGGEIFEIVVEDERTRRLAGLKKGPVASSGEVIIKAPMPGVVVEVMVALGTGGIAAAGPGETCADGSGPFRSRHRPALVLTDESTQEEE